MFLGVDCGTQGTKVVICDSRTNTILGSGYGKHDIISNDSGRREQHVQWWIDAFKLALKHAKQESGIELTEIKAIGISGQQHGMVVLDKFDNPIYPAKLWCDTESSKENAEIIEKLGGHKAFMDRVGIQLQTGYTASKILWLYRNHPDVYAKIDKIMLPHDYLNYWLTGEFKTDFGDASGTGYMSIHDRQYDEDVFAVVAPNLDIESHLPQLISAETMIGKIKPEIAQLLGLSSDVMIASGGGDNMMGAIGTGNIKAGTVTMSLGTSGTLYAYSDKPMASDDGMIASFCSSSNGWLPLICTMNVTASTTLMRTLFDIELDTFTQMLQQTRPGANGITLLPFFSGERIPPLPNATASLHGLTTDNLSQANIIRATTEAATFTIRYGLDLFREQGIEPEQIRLIGGGAKNAEWRQMVADIMNTPVICPLEHEAAALGGAIQAMWAYNHANDTPVSLDELCDIWVGLDPKSEVRPISNNVLLYEQSYQAYRRCLSQTYAF
ncbi:xylulokinase [Vibrio viridaestus]|uniref:Xylulose kinase n=1 Tax=Vibrio viridaestus TaxID=2487322 RepID=A0A3N9THJ3_9VIBR|nr:xylulokinase [Vibrio viridaestus]RQW63639.1 xylulokinase [Vibrio viridaestus]